MEEQDIISLANTVLEEYQETNSLEDFFLSPYYGVTEFRKFLKKLGRVEMSKLDKNSLIKIRNKMNEIAQEENKNNFLATINEKILNWIELCNQNYWRYNLKKNDGLFYFSLLDDYGGTDGGVDYVYFSESVTDAIEGRMIAIRQKQEEENKKIAALKKLTEEERKLLGLK